MQAAQAGLRRALGTGPTRLHPHEGHLLIHPARVKTGTGGSYRVYTPFARAVRAAGPVPPVGAISASLATGTLRAQDLILAPDMYRGAAVLTYLVLYDSATGSVSLAHMTGDPVEGRDFQLWIARGAEAPVSLGVITAGVSTRVEIAYARGKTSVAADLPILPELAEEIANLPAEQNLFITQEDSLLP